MLWSRLGWSGDWDWDDDGGCETEWDLLGDSFLLGGSLITVEEFSWGGDNDCVLTESCSVDWK